jgi:GTPase
MSGPEEHQARSHAARKLAAESLHKLLHDPDIPEEVRALMQTEFSELARALEKLTRDEVHIGVFGRVSVGKSALLNALLAREEFSVGVLHGTTEKAEQEAWQVSAAGSLHVIDTPGIDEWNGEARERLAYSAAARVDVILFVLDGDMTDTEYQALLALVQPARPLLVVLNKADQYRAEDVSKLLNRLQQRCAGIVPPENILAVSARPRPRTVLRVDAAGVEHESTSSPPADIQALRARLETLLQQDGRQLAAVSAGLMASQMSDQLAERLIAVRADVAATLVHTYSLSKGVAVGLNPVPVADLLAAAGIDVLLVVHLSRIYGLPLTKVEAGQLIGKICAQLAALMGAIWGVHLVASALKGVSVGLSTALTAGAQGALAYYATMLTGRAAERYLQNGKSWGELGPKRVVRQILDNLDRESILRDARAKILDKLSAKASS